MPYGPEDLDLATGSRPGRRLGSLRPGPSTTKTSTMLSSSLAWGFGLLDGGVRLLHQRCVVLGHFVHLPDGGGHLRNAALDRFGLEFSIYDPLAGSRRVP